jgi:hypothetical protein
MTASANKRKQREKFRIVEKTSSRRGASSNELGVGKEGDYGQFAWKNESGGA